MKTDAIEKKIVLRAPVPRVWRALTDSEEFGAWFGLRFHGPFVPGADLTGRLTVPGYEHLPILIKVERIEPQRIFSFRWHPYAIDPKVDYSSEPMTLIEFELREVDGGTELKVTESGFDQIPLARRAEAFRMNDGGWSQQIKNIERHVGG
jgi:uncharacterized protein YndB with AHSA1/START domain